MTAEPPNNQSAKPDKTFEELMAEFRELDAQAQAIRDRLMQVTLKIVQRANAEKEKLGGRDATVS